jgi:hypothetical protein
LRLSQRCRLSQFGILFKEVRFPIKAMRGAQEIPFEAAILDTDAGTRPSNTRAA